MRRSTLLFHLTQRLLYTKWRDPGEEPIEWAIGDKKTELPEYLVDHRPPAWSKSLEEQLKTIKERLKQEPRDE
jgi:hypothetical protein